MFEIDWLVSMVCGRPYAGKSGVDYKKAVLDLVKKSPMRRQWLVNQLCPSIMSEKKLDKTLKELADDGKLIKDSKAPESRGGWETWYMLPGDKYLLDIDAERITLTVERLKSLLLCMPTEDDVALELGIIPAEAEKLLYKYATLIGWYHPTSTELGDAWYLLGESLVCAARIRDGHITDNGKSDTFEYDIEYALDANILKTAKRFLTEHQDLLPNLSKDGRDVASWPAQTLRYLGGDYQPSKSHLPTPYDPFGIHLTVGLNNLRRR
jgi:hypothetical protein